MLLASNDKRHENPYTASLIDVIYRHMAVASSTSLCCEIFNEILYGSSVHKIDICRVILVKVPLWLSPGLPGDFLRHLVLLPVSLNDTSKPLMCVLLY